MAKKKRSSPPPIADLRKIDREILRLISVRAELLQNTAPDSLTTPSGAPAENPGPLSDRAVASIFREIDSGCRQLAAPRRVAYLGPEHTFSHIAAITRFGNSAELVPVGSIAAVFDEVEQGLAQYGMVPLENSTDGRVSDTLEGFARSSVRICGEVPLTIHHALLGQGLRSKIRQVASKPQALSQCRNWLAKHLPQAEVVAVG